jgi:hypothetical protein
VFARANDNKTLIPLLAISLGFLPLLLKPLASFLSQALKVQSKINERKETVRVYSA